MVVPEGQNPDPAAAEPTPASRGEGSESSPPTSPPTSHPFTGGCHCGRVRFRVTAALENLLVCNCSVCVKKGFWHWIVPTAEFELVSGEGDLSTYVFNTGVARHRFCRHCGIHAFYTPRSDPDKVDVNARCIDSVNLEQLSRMLKPFDGQNWEAAAAERHGT